MSFTALTKRLDELTKAASPGPSRAIDLQIVEASAEIPILVPPATTGLFSEAEANAELHAPAHEYAAVALAAAALLEAPGDMGLADIGALRDALTALAAALGVSDEV